MRVTLLSLMLAAAALAQDAPAVIPAGVPLRVALEKRVPLKHVGDPIRGRLVEPIYGYDRVLLPAGTLVEGHVAAISGPPLGRRMRALLSGNLTPRRDALAQFDRLTPPGSLAVAVQTVPARGVARTARISKPGKKGAEHNGAPGKLSRLKSTLFGMLPYHRQSWQPGTAFTSALVDPLTGLRGSAAPPADESAPQEVTARLLTPLNSATARKGAPVEAIVTRPLFSPDHRILVPEGSRLTGEVVEARRARRLHRNGKMQFVFRQIQLPDRIESIQGYLEGFEADADASLALDSEGAARASSPKTRFIFPALAVAAAGLSLHQDYNSEGVPDQDIAGRAESGAVGLGVIGMAVAQASRAVASTIAFTGAAFSVYSNFIARGRDVVLPANTLVQVAFKDRQRDNHLKEAQP